MMFQWSEDMVRFMRQASEYGDYHRRLADWMRPDLHKRDRLCDAGCGLGYLSLALAPYVQHITAADRNGDALAVLRENCAARGIDNIDIRCGDLFSMPPATAYDAMVFCFFGRMEEIAAIAKAQCRGTVFAFKKNYTTHRFSVGSHVTKNMKCQYGGNLYAVIKDHDILPHYGIDENTIGSLYALVDENYKDIVEEEEVAYEG